MTYSPKERVVNLVINLTTVKALDLDIPRNVPALAYGWSQRSACVVFDLVIVAERGGGRCQSTMRGDAAPLR